MLPAEIGPVVQHLGLDAVTRDGGALHETANRRVWAEIVLTRDAPQVLHERQAIVVWVERVGIINKPLDEVRNALDRLRIRASRKNGEAQAPVRVEDLNPRALLLLTPCGDGQDAHDIRLVPVGQALVHLLPQLRRGFANVVGARQLLG